MKSFVQRFTAAQSEPGVLHISVNHGFEGSDQPDLSTSVVVTTDADEDLAASVAQRIGEDMLTIVLNSTWVGPGVSDSIDEALSYEARPVVIADRPTMPVAARPETRRSSSLNCSVAVSMTQRSRSFGTR